MKTSELRDLTSDELDQKAQETRIELFNTKVKQATGQLENTSKLKDLRRDFARIKTLQRERQEASS